MKKNLEDYYRKCDVLQRLKLEKNALQEKLEKLNDVLLCPHKFKISQNQKELLEVQQPIMISYLEILRKRIKDLEQEILKGEL